MTHAKSVSDARGLTSLYTLNPKAHFLADVVFTLLHYYMLSSLQLGGMLSANNTVSRTNEKRFQSIQMHKLFCSSFFIIGFQINK